MNAAGGPDRPHRRPPRGTAEPCATEPCATEPCARRHHAPDTDTPADAVESWDLPYDLGATSAERVGIRATIDAGVLVPTTYGDPLYPYGAGRIGW